MSNPYDNRDPQRGGWVQPPGPAPHSNNPHAAHGDDPYAASFAAQRAAMHQAAPPGWDGRSLGPVSASAADQSQRFMTQVFGWMAMGLGLTALVAWGIFASGLVWTVAPLAWPLFAVELALVFGLTMMIRKGVGAGFATAAFLFYAALNGVTLSAIFVLYSLGSIAQVFVIAAMTFGFMFVFGWTTKRDLTAMGSLAMMALFGVIVAMLLNWFIFKSAGLSMGISALVVLLFVGLTAWDAQKIKQIGAYGFSDGNTARNMAIYGALTLYLDFINLFIHLLRLVGSRD